VWWGYAGTLYSTEILERTLDAVGMIRGEPVPVLDKTGAFMAMPLPPLQSGPVILAPGWMPPPDADAVPRPSAALLSTLDQAPDDLRSLRVALDDCDASLFEMWIVFPIYVGDTRYKDAHALARACKAGQLAVPTPAALAAAFPTLTVSDRAATMKVGERTWHLVWRARSWMLSGID
jgi:hypothetical protein